MSDTDRELEGEERDQWVFILDPAWQPPEGDETADPPLEAVVGGWYVEADGTTGRFHANPDFVPTSPDSPTDPVDATLRLVTQGEANVEELFSVMREVLLGVAVDSFDNPVVASSPDDVPSLLVTTAPAHRDGLDVDSWLEVSVAELADVLPDEGIDVLLNPGSPVSIRLLASALKESLADAE